MFSCKRDGKEIWNEGAWKVKRAGRSVMWNEGAWKVKRAGRSVIPLNFPLIVIMRDLSALLCRMRTFSYCYGTLELISPWS
jgi:hypothetical protein